MLAQYSRNDNGLKVNKKDRHHNGKRFEFGLNLTFKNVIKNQNKHKNVHHEL